jgi:hypothetical protein
MLVSGNISHFLCFARAVRNDHLGIEAVRLLIAVKPTLRGVNEMIGVHRLPNQSSHAFDDVSTPVFDRAFVIVIPCHILENV